MSEPNKFPGICYRCGQRVAIGEGEVDFLRLPGLVWKELKGTKNYTLLEHAACAITFKGTHTHYLYAPSHGNAQ